MLHGNPQNKDSFSRFFFGGKFHLVVGFFIICNLICPKTKEGFLIIERRN